MSFLLAETCLEATCVIAGVVIDVWVSCLVCVWQTICSVESLPLTSAALSALCEASGNDVRASLNTLQFFKNRQDANTAHDGTTPGQDASHDTPSPAAWDV